MARLLGKPEVDTHTLHQLFNFQFGIMLLDVFEHIYFVLARIALRHFEELRPVAPAWNRKRNPGHLDFGRLGHDNLVIDCAESLADLFHGVCKQFGTALVKPALITQGNAADNGATAHMHIVYVDIGIVVIDTEHIDIVDCLTDDNAFRLIAFNQSVRLLQFLRLLKPEFCGEPGHFVPEI